MKNEQMKNEQNEILLRKIEGTSLFQIGDKVKFKENSRNSRFFKNIRKNLVIKRIIDIKKDEYDYTTCDLKGTKSDWGYVVEGIAKMGGKDTYNVMEEELELDKKEKLI